MKTEVNKVQIKGILRWSVPRRKL